MHVDLSRPSPYDQSNGLLPIYSALHNSVDRDSLNSGRADQLARLQQPRSGTAPRLGRRGGRRILLLAVVL
jgi:hypothetical protein